MSAIVSLTSSVGIAIPAALVVVNVNATLEGVAVNASLADFGAETSLIDFVPWEKRSIAHRAAMIAVKTPTRIVPALRDKSQDFFPGGDRV